LDFGLKKIKRRKERRGMIIDFRWKMTSLRFPPAFQFRRTGTFGRLAENTSGVVVIGQ